MCTIEVELILWLRITALGTSTGTQLLVVMCSFVAADVARDNVGEMDLAGSSNSEFLACEMDDSEAHNDAAVTFTSHTGSCSVSS